MLFYIKILEGFMEFFSKKKNIYITLVVLTIISFIAGVFWTNPDNHVGSIAYINKKISEVMGMTASSTFTSVGISAIPGEVGVAVSDQLMDFSFYFLIIMSGLYLEKYFLILSGYATFYILIPAVLGLFSLWISQKKDFYYKSAKKILILSILLISTIPISVHLSKQVDNIYKTTKHSYVSNSPSEYNELYEDGQFDDGFFNGLKDMFDDAIGNIKTAGSGLIEKAQEMVVTFVEGIAVMLITSIVIPILTFFILLRGSNFILKFSASSPTFPFFNNLNDKLNKRIQPQKALNNKNDKDKDTEI